MSVGSIKAEIRAVEQKIRKYKELKNRITILKDRCNNAQNSEIVFAEDVYEKMLKENEDTSEGNFLIDLEVQGEEYVVIFNSLKRELESAAGGLSGKEGAAQAKIDQYEAEKSRLEVALREAEEEERRARENALKSLFGIKG